jgi:hypothetical protein
MNSNWLWIVTVTGLLIIITLGGMLVFVSFSCSKDYYNRVPVVVTTTISNITQTSVSVGGNVRYDQGSKITSLGVCWSKEAFPDLLDHVIALDTISGKFECSIKGLSPNTIYYVRAFATNKSGTGYGDVISFRTSQINDVTQLGLIRRTLYFRNNIQICNIKVPVSVRY